MLSTEAIDHVLRETLQDASDVAHLLNILAAHCDKELRPDAASMLRVLTSDFINHPENYDV